MKSRDIRQIVLPLLAAIIWGTSFVFQSDSVGVVGPFTFTALRSGVGALFLALVLLVRRLFTKKTTPREESAASMKSLLVGGLLCGTVLMTAINFQQFGIRGGASPGKAAFITALYVVLVPLASLLFLRKKQSPVVWGSVMIAVVGLYFLCVSGVESVAAHDVLLFLCAMAFAAHILVIERFSAQTDGIALSCVQFAVDSLWSMIGMFAFEEPTWASIVDCAVPILYVGIMSSGIAYTLQIIAQKGSNATVVTLLLCLESVFASVADVLMRGRWMSDRETIGAVLMLTAVILAEIPRETWARLLGRSKQ